MIPATGGRHEGAVVRARRLAAAIAAHARDETLLLGYGIEGLAEALWERVPSVHHGVEDPIRRLDLLRRAAELGVGGYVTFGPATRLEQAWETVIVDAEGGWGASSPETLRALLAPGGRLFLMGRSGRPIDGPGPSRFPTPSALVETFVESGARLTALQLPDRDRYLVRVELPAPESAELTGAAGAEREGAYESVSDASKAEPRISTDERVPVTVAMPTAGRSAWLRDAIESVLGQTVPPVAFIVVSDGGGENVRRAVEPYRDRISLVEIPAGGQAAAMNRALRDVKTEFVAWLDDDDYFLPRKLELQIEDLLAHPSAAFGVTEHYVVSPEDEVLEWRPVVSFDPGQVLRLLLGGSFFLGPTAMVRTAHYRALGPDPYEVHLRRAADYAMWFELAERGAVRVLPLALSAIRRHAGNQVTRERIALMRDAARRTLGRAIARWPLETFFPGIAEAGTSEEERETRALALLERAGHLLRVGLVDEALSDLRAGLEIRPEDGRLRHFYALASMEAGAFGDAVGAFEAARRAGAPAAEVACGLGTIAHWQGRREDALRHFRQALIADPGSELALYNVALVESAGGVSSSAFALARRLMSRGRPHGYLLSPSPPLEGVEAELVRLRRAERGLPAG